MKYSQLLEDPKIRLMKEFYINKIKDLLRPGYHFTKDLFDLPGKKRLRKNIVLKNLHKGERCFLLLTGESLQQNDIVKLKDENTFGIGFIFLHKDIRNINLTFYMNAEPSKSLNSDNPNWPKSCLGPLGQDGITQFHREIDERLDDSTTLILNSDNYKDAASKLLFRDKTTYFIKTKKDLCLNDQIPYEVVTDLTKRSVSGGGSVFFAIMIMMYMGFKEIYLCGAGYTYEPAHLWHFYDNLVFPKSMGKEKAKTEAIKAIEAHNHKFGSTLEYYGLSEKDDLYRVVAVDRTKGGSYMNMHQLLNNYVKSQGIKIYNVVPDGFASPVYEKISWQEIESKILSGNTANCIQSKGDDEDMEKHLLLPKESEQKIAIKDDFELLDIMLNDSKSQPPLYQPGPYWATKSKNTEIEIKRCGLGEFRGSNNAVGLSYADNLLVDVRDLYNHDFKKRFLRCLANTYPLNIILKAQIRCTESHANKSIVYAQEILNLKERTKELLRKYHFPYSLLGDCLAKANIDGQDLSIHYLDILEHHDNIASHINFNEAKSAFEIGGGFGTNVHLLLENYKNIRKILYLDIPPNLYVGTQYLKAFYGDAVIDFRSLRNQDSIKFSANDNLEIFCIAPWQIERIESPVDIFMNSRSFAEMPKDTVKNYIDNFKRLPESKDSAIALITYEHHDPDTLLHPNEWLKLFKGRKFDSFEADTLLDSSSKNFYFVSPGKLSLQ